MMTLLSKFQVVCLSVMAVAGSSPLLAQGGSPGLESVLSQMDSGAARFRSAEATLTSEQYTKVINESETQRGKVYYRRHDHDVEMALDIAEPDKKYVVYSGGKVQVYQPKIDQITQYDAGKNRADVESFLVLGFGGGGHDLLKSYDVTLAGSEMIDGVQTSKVQLIPKSQRVRNNFDHIVLWIDPARGISIQQQFFQPAGDYRLAKYTDIQLNQKVPDSAFKIKTTSKTKTVSP